MMLSSFLVVTLLSGVSSPAIVHRPANPSLQASAEQERARAEAERQKDAERQKAEAERQRASSERDRERELRAYERAQEALERSSWALAVTRFDELAAVGGARVDAALYWKAYALDRLGQRADALAVIADLAKGYPKSRWLSDARALEVQVRQRAGQPVAVDAADEELKLLALNALQHTDPAQAVPMLQQILKSAQAIKLKERALFVLAQSSSEAARATLAEVAKQGNPDLQRRAINYLGVHGSAANRALLADIYQSASDVDVKRQILRAYMVSGDRTRVLAAATGESNPELRGEAVRQLGVMSAHDELWQLYQKEATVEVKQQILQAMFVGGNSTRLIELAKTETNVELRRVAVRNLGLMGASRTGQALVDLYRAERDSGIRRAAIQGLFVQNNADALVTLARAEKDPEMKRELVQKLSVMSSSKVALAYMLELLGK